MNSKSPLVICSSPTFTTARSGDSTGGTAVFVVFSGAALVEGGGVVGLTTGVWPKALPEASAKNAGIALQNPMHRLNIFIPMPPSPNSTRDVERLLIA